MTTQQLHETAREVLKRTAGGQSVRDIATALGITTQAVYHHLTTLRKLGYLPPKEGAA